ILAPWAEYLIRPESARTALMRIMEPALMVLFLVLVCFGYGALRRVRLGPAKWTLLLLIPIFHWFAVHRMVTNLHSKLQHRMQERGHVVKDEPGFKALILVSDITWILSMLPWGLILFLSLLHNHLPAGLAYSAIRICGIAFAVVFAVGNLASMEYLQRQFVNEIRKL
ncbi:MAG: hypothetical protein JSV03_02960, partial [Planctomycetota bacterium]